MIDTPFLRTLEMIQPAFSGTLVHRNFRVKRKELTSLVAALPQATIVCLVGPAHVGKSMLLKHFVRHMRENVFLEVPDQFSPMIGASALVSRDARTTPKYLYSELQADLGNPFFSPFGPGFPVGKDRLPGDETSLLRSLRAGLVVRDTRVVIVDEGDYIVRTKDPAFASLLVESLKSLVTPRTTLCIAGGYDLANAMLGRAHVAARKVLIHVPSYSLSNEDRKCWRSIVASIGRSTRFSPSARILLTGESDRLLEDSNGVIGILEKRLTHALAIASANDSDLSRTILGLSDPTELEWNTVRADIERGAKLIGRKGTECSDTRSGSEASKSLNKNAAKRKKTKPFERGPKRSAGPGS
nr:AAA family ATPase [Luteibacter rhizovicinus]